MGGSHRERILRLGKRIANVIKFALKMLEVGLGTLDFGNGLFHSHGHIVVVAGDGNGMEGDRKRVGRHRKYLVFGEFIAELGMDRQFSR